VISIKEQAEKELEEEAFRASVDKYKLKLKEKKRWFPYRVQIINLNKDIN